MQDDATREQLALIALVHSVLEPAGIAHWLGGGWGVDFTLGRVTRLHHDIDFAVWSADWPAIESLLVCRGMTAKVPEFPDETRRLLSGPHDLEFWMLEKDNQGRVVVGGRWSDWPFVDGSLDAPPGELDGVECPVLSAESHLETKENFSAHPLGRPPRDKDVRDVELLRQHMSRPARSGLTRE